MSRAELDQTVSDLRAECEELHRLLYDADTALWTQHSAFKGWTVWDVIAHLHFSDHMALTSLASADDFRALMQSLRQAGAGAVTRQWLRGDTERDPTGPELLERWRETWMELCERLTQADPDARYAWAGPDMKARMFATARQMETWAHGWEIWDLLGLPRAHGERLINIATIGVRTFGWTFKNRGLEPPGEPPHVSLTSPGGQSWSWHDGNAGHIRGSAVEFCQVVTQVRNVADTRLDIDGDNAEAWMAIAQCFAGPPEDPPAPGTRVPASHN